MSDTNAALAVPAACATVTNLFGLEYPQFTAVMRPKLPGWPGTAANSFRVALPTGLWSLQALNSENQQFILMTSLLSGSMWPRGSGLPVGQMTCGETSWVPGASILGAGSDETWQDSLLVVGLGACV